MSPVADTCTGPRPQVRVPFAMSLLTTAALVAGCTHTPDSQRAATPSENGPVRIGNNPGQNCMPPSRTGAVAIGFDVVHSTATQPVTVTAVTLQGGKGLHVTESYLMPMRHTTLIGVTNSWPPDTADATRGDWDHRVRAVGTNRLAQTTGVRDWNLVLKLTTDPAVTTPGYETLALHYTVEGKRYVARNGTSLVVKQPC